MFAINLHANFKNWYSVLIMKQCKECGQILSEKITTCPDCGSHIVKGIKYIDDYKIVAIIHEGRSSLVCNPPWPHAAKTS